MCVLICITVCLSTIASSDTMTIKKVRISKSQVLRVKAGSSCPATTYSSLPEAKMFSPKKLKPLPTISFSYLPPPPPPPMGARVGGRQAKEDKLSWITKALHMYSSFPQYFLHILQLAVFHFLICISSQNNPEAHLQNSGHAPELPNPSSIIYSFPNFPTIFTAPLPSPPLLLCLLTLP